MLNSMHGKVLGPWLLLSVEEKKVMHRCVMVCKSAAGLEFRETLGVSNYGQWVEGR